MERLEERHVEKPRNDQSLVGDSNASDQGTMKLVVADLPDKIEVVAAAFAVSMLELNDTRTVQ